jgi:glycosyltransferase involved in cell wall biosynthesis
MHKILIVGPIEDFGGREIEAGFIAEALSKNYWVDIFSTGNISKKSQVYEFNFRGEITSLKKEIYRSNFIIRGLSHLSFLKNEKKHTKYFYVNNNLGKKLGFKKKENSILFNMISRYDVIFIVANIETLRIKEIINLSNQLNKKIIFRTTGEIGSVKLFPDYLKNVSVFLHHSENNAKGLHKGENFSKYILIDQSVHKEKEILKNKIVSKPVNIFGVISRLSRGKNIDTLINYFLKYSDMSDKLYIVGDGKEGESLREKYSKRTNIVFKGYVPREKLPFVFQEFDCLIIPSASEAGPLVGVEAMAAGKIILSTETGAMPDRLKDTYNDFWFQVGNEKSFEKQFHRIKNLKSSEVVKIGNKNRIIYNQNYSQRNIADKYRNAVSETLINRSEICL